MRKNSSKTPKPTKKYASSINHITKFFQKSTPQSKKSQWQVFEISFKKVKKALEKTKKQIQRNNFQKEVVDTFLNNLERELKQTYHYYKKINKEMFEKALTACINSINLEMYRSELIEMVKDLEDKTELEAEKVYLNIKAWLVYSVFGLSLSKFESAF